MNFRPSHRREEQVWFSIMLWSCLAVVIFVMASMLAGCKTSTAQPDGTFVQDPLSVTLGKRAKQTALILATAKGAMQGYADSGTITQATADRNKATIDKVLLAMSVVVKVGADGQTTLVQCFIDATCTDEQNMQAAEALGQAFALIGQLTPLLDKKK